jgi:hypothetical protein
MSSGALEAAGTIVRSRTTIAGAAYRIKGGETKMAGVTSL